MPTSNRSTGHTRRQLRNHLDPAAIRLFNWNIAKGATSSWLQDLQRLANHADILLLQEAVLERHPKQHLDALHHSDFAHGYRTKKMTSGVMTLSQARSVDTQHFFHTEPLLRSPKCTLLTEYPLANRNESLLVANMHVVIFTFGIREFTRQIHCTSERIAAHRGPVIFSGDFNTWNTRRERILQQCVQASGLSRVAFAEDHRLKLFGKPLDHIFYRDLDVVESHTFAVRSSDHHPMTVTFRYR